MQSNDEDHGTFTVDIPEPKKTPWKVTPELEQAMKEHPEMKMELDGVIQVNKDASRAEVEEKVKAYLQDKLGPNVRVGDIKMVAMDGSPFDEDLFQSTNVMTVDQLLFNRAMYLCAKYDIDDALMFSLLMKTALSFLRLAPKQMQLSIIDEMFPRVRATFAKTGDNETASFLRTMLSLTRTMAQLDPDFKDDQLEVTEDQIDFLRKYNARAGSRREKEDQEISRHLAGDLPVLAGATGNGRKDD